VPRNSSTGPDGNEVARLLLEATTDYALLMKPDGAVCVCNERLAELLGQDVRTLCGRCIYDFFRPEAAAKRRAVVDLVCLHKAPIRYDDHTSDGRILDTRIQPLVDTSGQVHRIAIHITDVTHQVRTEHDRFLLASAIEQAAEAVVILDPNLTIRSVNQTFEEMTGYGASEARGMPLERLYIGRRQMAVLRRISDTLARGDIWSGRTVNTRKDGSLVVVAKTVSPIRGRGGTIHGYVSIWRDQTREAELEKQLRHAQKMEAVGTLAGGIAHDFNNVLGPIILHAELGLNALPADEPSRDHFGHILDAAERARGLVNQILKLSRRNESEETIPFRLTLLLKECLKLLRPTLHASIRIETELCTDRDVILADPTEIHQLIMNLATNAAHAMEEKGGTLTFRVGLTNQVETVTGVLSQAAPGMYVALTVADTGKGMEPIVREHIFDPFFTTRGDGRGTGLGLAVVHNIVTGLGGAVLVESEPGKGTSFLILLPVSPERVPEHEDEHPAVHAASDNS